MKSHFRHIALVGKYQFTPSSAPTSSSADILEHVAQFLYTQGCEVAIEMKDAPGLFTQSGMRLPIGPVFKKQPKARKSRSRKSKGAQTLPAEIAHIFANPSVSL